VKSTRLFWQAIRDSVPWCGPAGALPARFGTAYAALSRFLRPTAELAKSYPCPHPGPDGCPMGVVVHPGAHIVAVCRSRRRLCSRLSLTLEQIIIPEVTVHGLIERVTHELAVVGASPSPVPGLPRTHVLGRVSAAQRDRRVYLSLDREGDRLTEAVARIALRDPDPFVMLTALSEVPLLIESEIAARGSAIVPLSDVTWLDDRDRLVATGPLRDVLGGPSAAPRNASRSQPVGESLALAPGTRWEDVEIVFRDGHTVSVRAGTDRAILHYSQMGLVNRTNSAPDRQWLLLEAMSREYGMLTQRNGHRDPRNKMRRHRLAERLVSFFGIHDGDPIPFDKELGGWRTRFVLRPEDDVS
jgi:hypothetical protein